MTRPKPAREPELKASVIKEQARLIGQDAGVYFANGIINAQEWVIEELDEVEDLITARYWSEQWAQMRNVHAVRYELEYLGSLHEDLLSYPHIMNQFAQGVRKGVHLAVTAAEEG